MAAKSNPSKKKKTVGEIQKETSMPRLTSGPIVATFDQIIDPGNSSKWSLLRPGATQNQNTYLLNEEACSTCELKNYQFRELAHQNQLSEDAFADALKARQFPELQTWRAYATVPDRRQRAEMTDFPPLDEFVLRRMKNLGHDGITPNLLSRRLLTFNLPRAGSQQERWNRLVKHVYNETPRELLAFALRQANQVPEMRRTKRELFNDWHELEQTPNPVTLLDAWHHSPDYRSRADEPDVSDLALEAEDLDLADRATRHALRPAYLRAVTRFHDVDAGDLPEEALLPLARELDRVPRIKEPSVRDLEHGLQAKVALEHLDKGRLREALMAAGLTQRPQDASSVRRLIHDHVMA